MYTKTLATGQVLKFDDYREKEISEISFYRHPNGTIRLYAPHLGILNQSIHTYLYGLENMRRVSYEHINGDRFDFRDENVKQISRGDKFRDTPPRDGKKYKGFTTCHGIDYVVVYMLGDKIVRFCTDGWTDSKRAALYNAVKDYEGLSGWRNPTEDTYVLTSDDIDIIEKRKSGQRKNYKDRQNTRKTIEKHWRTYY